MDDVVAIYSIIYGLLNADGHITSSNSKSISTTSIYVKDWLCSFGTLAGIPTYLIDTYQPNNTNHKAVYRVGICSSDRYRRAACSSFCSSPRRSPRTEPTPRINPSAW